MVEESKKLLSGWKYPIYTNTLEAKIVNLLVREGVPRELVRDESTDNKNINRFDFLATLNPPSEKPPHIEDRVIIFKITDVQWSKDGTVRLSTERVLTIPLTEKS